MDLRSFFKTHNGICCFFFSLPPNRLATTFLEYVIARKRVCLPLDQMTQDVWPFHKFIVAVARVEFAEEEKKMPDVHKSGKEHLYRHS